jgi:hypothetical protein
MGYTIVYQTTMQPHKTPIGCIRAQIALAESLNMSRYNSVE